MSFKRLACLFLAFAAPVLADPAKPYNILMIAVDDLNDWVGAFGGNPQAKNERCASNHR
jgi:choline-sulfatase